MYEPIDTFVVVTTIPTRSPTRLPGVGALVALRFGDGHPYPKTWSRQLAADPLNKCNEIFGPRAASEAKADCDAPGLVTNTGQSIAVSETSPHSPYGGRVPT
jgi:hypothetical protein